MDEKEEKDQVVEEANGSSGGKAEPEIVDARAEEILRLQAEFANFRRASIAEANTIAQRAVGESVRALTPALDALRIAVGESSDKKDGRFAEGLQKVYDRFVQSLATLGIVPVPAKGAYDPKFHEAVERVAGEEYAIMEVVGGGWMWRDGERVVVPAKVKVGAGNKIVNGDKGDNDVSSGNGIS